ncbi:hypothetical protein MTF69_16950 [Streptomyces sp. AP-93]|nr:hypothetical protein [Streptomyces sp. AP-93]
MAHPGRRGPHPDPAEGGGRPGRRLPRGAEREGRRGPHDPGGRGHAHRGPAQPVRPRRPGGELLLLPDRGLRGRPAVRLRLPSAGPEQEREVPDGLRQVSDRPENEQSAQQSAEPPTERQ